MAAFKDWLEALPEEEQLRKESADVYRDMWGAFVNFCVPLDAATGARHIRCHALEGLRVADLRRFLASADAAAAPRAKPRTRNGPLSDRYAWRMLHLIDRVLRFAGEPLGHDPAEAVRALMREEPYRYANAADQTPLPEILTDAEADRLIAHVTAIRSLATDQPLAWKEIRDRSAVALMLGAGLSLGDVRSLRLEAITLGGGTASAVPWRLTIAADGTSPEHQAPIAAWAGRQLAVWLEIRALQRIPAPWVFPSTASGKAWSHPSCYQAVVAVLDSAGVGGGTPFRLRHSFAVRQLRKGRSEDEVARWMGYVDTKPLKRYRHLLTRPADVA